MHLVLSAFVAFLGGALGDQVKGRILIGVRPRGHFFEKYCLPMQPRVAVLFRGRHASSKSSAGGESVKLWRGAFAAQRELLVAPLVAAGAVVDIFVNSPNSSSWAAMEADYRSLAEAGSGSFAATTASADGLLAGRHEDDPGGALALARAQCQSRWAAAAAEARPAACWSAVLVWHFGVSPRVPASQLRFAEGALVSPWREAAWALPTTATTQTARQVYKSCMAYRNKYEADARGWRAAHAVFWFDGAAFDTFDAALTRDGGGGGERRAAH